MLVTFKACQPARVAAARALTIAAVSAGVFAAAAPREAAADSVLLQGDAIKSTVVGRTVDLDTPLGKPITVTYKENGALSGTAGAALGIYLGAPSDRGRWWVENGRLCQKFFKWLEGETSCLRLRLNGNRIAWTRDDGKTGTATITNQGPVMAQTGYGLGGANFAPSASRGTTDAPAVHAPEMAAPEAVSPPAAHESRPKSLAPLAMRADLTPALVPPTPRRVLASLGGAAASFVPVEPRPLAPSLGATVLPPEGLLPADWSSDSDVGLPSAAVRAMVAATRRAHARHRWCHDVRDYRLLLRPQAVDAEAPELLTAARHMQAPETSAVPAASCVVASPALQDAARALVDMQ